jgi:lipid II isoglutaminyl synthase (glutamine-hydrolysing)
MHGIRSRRIGVRLRIATMFGSLAAAASRRLRFGGGTSIGGRVLVAVEPRALALLAAGRRIALVTGTNGKTTTTKMLATALATTGPVVTNGDGANVPYALAMTLARDRHARLAVLEVDERFVPSVLASVDPVAVLLLNLTRDQLDRNVEVHGLALRWRTALEAAGGCVVVANVDDPFVVWAASAAAEVVWVAAGSTWPADATLCPACGEPVARTELDWRCAGCELRRPAPRCHPKDDGLLRFADGSEVPIALRLPGRVNLGNAAMAVAAARVVADIPAAVAADALSSIAEVAGRYATVSVGGRRRTLLLAKNPAGWTEALAMLPPDVPLVLLVNARDADGHDPSWLWDVPFEQLRGRDIVVGGERAADVAVRLHYGEVEHTVAADVRQALRHHDGEAVVLANYTAFRGVLAAVDAPVSPRPAASPVAASSPTRG